MTLQIHRKHMPFTDFEPRVSAFLQAKLDHQKTVDMPAPTEHPMVEAAVTRVSRGDKPDDYVADYQIIEPTLEEKKKDLEHELHRLRDLALYAKLSSAKRRKLGFDIADIHAKPPHEHADDDIAVIAKHKEILDHHDYVERHAARLHVEIEDLTEETIDSWKPAPFPT